MRSSKLVCSLVLALGTVLSLSVLVVLHTAQAAPATTLQSMIDLAPDGGTVSIAAGTYTESLTVNKTLTLTGVSSATTIIQAVIGQRVITVTAGHNLRLENLTVTSGHPTGDAGGGVYAAGGNLQIINCRIANNSARWGGGVFQESSSGRLDMTDSRIELNTSADQGGGMFVRGSAALTDTLVLSNTAGLYGGGLHVDSGRADLIGGLFSNNVASNSNGGAVNLNNSISVTGTQFISNTAVQDGGALLQWNAGYTVTVTNAHFERNTANRDGGGLWARGSVTMTNGLFVSNTAAGSGGGAYLYLGSNTILQGNQVYSNTAGLGGGGVLLMSSSNAMLSSNQIHDNKGSNGAGGGIYVDSYAVRLNDNQIYRNTAGLGSGGGIYLGNSSNATLTGNRVYSNTADDRGGGLFLASCLTATLTNNQVYSNTATAGNGGGLDIENSSAATLTSNQVYSNTSANDGGGICLLTSPNAALSGNTIYGNASKFGGGIYAGGGNAQLTRNQVYYNTSWYGGGVYLLNNSSTVLAANSIYSNTVAWYGGGVYLNASSSKLVNTVIANNRASAGSGLYILDSSPQLLQTTLARNVGSSGVCVANSGTNYSTAAMTNTILVSQTVGITVTAGNTATLNSVLWYSNTANTGGAGAIAVTNDLTGTPAFAADGYHLTSISKAINAGIAAGVATDIDGEPRDAAPDLGADEFHTCWARLNDNTTDYGHVQAAVDASTLPADVVKVAGYCPGVQSRAGISQTVYVSKSLTLRGGYTLTNWTTSDPVANPAVLDAKQAGRVVFLTGGSGVNVTLENLTLRGGYINANGGGIYDDVTLTLSNAIVRDNVSNHGWGGGVFVQTAHATVSGGQILSNTAWVGSGVYVQSGSAVAVSRAQILSNTASVGGGGVYVNTGGALRVTDSTVSGNTGSWWGGGIVNQGSALTLTNSTLSGNRAISSTYGGGAIYQTSGSATIITNSTIVSNTAVNAARSGIWLESGKLTIGNSIIAQNSGTNNIAISGGTFTSLGYNLTNSGAGTPFTATGDLINTNPRLGPLQDNGGQTWTYALLPGSPAIDRIPFGVNGCGTSITTDQRGWGRPWPIGGQGDIGAYEVHPAVCAARFGAGTTYSSGDAAALQATVDAARAGDTVKVAGTCAGVQVRAGISQTVYIGKPLTVRGGYTLINWITSDPVANPTILDAKSGGRVVFIATGSAINVTLENLIARGGSTASSGGYGGGIFNGGMALLNNMSIVSNTSVNEGGGIFNNGGPLTVTNSTVSGNRAASFGGGIGSGFGGKLTLINNTLSGNQVTGTIGGGGAVDLYAGVNTTILNCTIVSNTAGTVSRSGIYLESNAGPLTIGNSIVAHNSVTNNVQIDGSAIFTSLGYNLTNSGAGTPFTATTDFINANPLLGPLQNNGGSSWTHALLPGSPAIDRIPFGVNGCGTTLTTDQRGWPRPFPPGGKCDIGAFESVFKIYLPLVIRQ